LEVASAHLQAARCHELLDDLHSAVRHFRLALSAEDSFPNVRTRAPIEFPWFIATHRVSTLYAEALSILDSRSSSVITFR